VRMFIARWGRDGRLGTKVPGTAGSGRRDPGRRRCRGPGDAGQAPRGRVRACPAL